MGGGLAPSVDVKNAAVRVSMWDRPSITTSSVVVLREHHPSLSAQPCARLGIVELSRGPQDA